MPRSPSLQVLLTIFLPFLALTGVILLVNSSHYSFAPSKGGFLNNGKEGPKPAPERPKALGEEELKTDAPKTQPVDPVHVAPPALGEAELNGEDGPNNRPPDNGKPPPPKKPPTKPPAADEKPAPPKRPPPKNPADRPTSIEADKPKSKPVIAGDVGDGIPAKKPDENGVRKAIVAAGLKGNNITWMEDFFPDWEHYVYVMNDKTADLTVPKNRGHEGSAYLTFLVNNYHDLPDYMVFLHALRYQWHNDDPMYDGVPVLRGLNLDKVDERGYVSMRCTHNPGCTGGMKPIASPGPDDNPRGIRARYADAFRDFFPELPVPTRVRAHCCGQFATSKAQVLKRKRSEYRAFRTFLWNAQLGDQLVGTLYEYMWHIFFGQKVDGCQPAGECFCENFGRCNLTCPDSTRCIGMWKSPPLMRPLPKKWPDEGQGEKGWLKEGWWEKDMERYLEKERKKKKEKEKQEKKKLEKEKAKAEKEKEKAKNPPRPP